MMGAGKSSFINAAMTMLHTEDEIQSSAAQVGNDSQSRTTEIKKISIGDHLNLWDSWGIGERTQDSYGPNTTTIDDFTDVDADGKTRLELLLGVGLLFQRSVPVLLACWPDTAMTCCPFCNGVNC